MDGVGWGHVAWGAGSPRCGSAGGSCGWKHLGCCPCAERPVIASSRTLAVPDTRCEAVAAAANLKGRELDREGWKILRAAEEVGANHPPRPQLSRVSDSLCPKPHPADGPGAPCRALGIIWDLGSQLCAERPSDEAVSHRAASMRASMGGCEVLGVFGRTSGHLFLGCWRDP